ncbi:MAG: redoxin domain-containing protein [Rhodospirillaceae bacterium]|nr:redoxin domain-containing protein [Rhodospirillaceae bacterium]
MSKRLKYLAAAAAIALAAPAPAFASPQVGKTAPDFTGVDSNGASVTLSALRGKLVVLEWTNHGCPYVSKHYGAGNMQKTQKAARAKGAVWLSIISSAPGRQGHVDGAAANRLTETRGAAPSHVILDPKGTIGRKYEATNTPHMFIVGKDGTLLYMGAIDSIRSANPADIPRAKNYVTAALSEIAAGKRVSEPVTRQYGCSVKYAY